MTSRIRAAALALVAALGLIAAPLLVASSASAAVPSIASILVFSNPAWTDQAEEDATIIADLAETGATITTFDGGDGSAAAWTAALAGKHVLVIPESGNVYVPGGTAVISDEAAAVILAFTDAGGRVIISGGYNPDLVSYLTGLDYTSVWSTSGGGSEPWLLQVADPALPAELTYSDGTSPLTGYDTWPAELLAGITPLYVDATGVDVAAAMFPVGTGFVAYLAYDWFPDTAPESAASHLVWNVVLQYLANVPVPEPALAETGVDSSIALTAGAGFLFLGATALVLMRTRRVERSL